MCIHIAQGNLAYELVAIADETLLLQRARQLGLPLALQYVDLHQPPQITTPGVLKILPIALNKPCVSGQLDPLNAAYVLKCLDVAVSLCLQNRAHALVTGPVQKSVINAAGYAFSGHTEYLAALTQSPMPVMMLTSGTLRIALATTHLPLSQVSQAIQPALLNQVISVLHHDLVQRFKITDPCIYICGLNPHAGEAGHLGREEIEIISPVVAQLKQQFQMNLVGPLPADTIFSPENLSRADVFLAMYHDQGLPVLKFHGFGNAVNITLGLPIIRTSVDHGTALHLAGTGKLQTGSIHTAIETALAMS